MRRAALRRTFRVAARALAATVGLVALCAVLLPLIFRGARLAWLVERVLPPMQGQLALGAGYLQPVALFALALGRPFDVRLENVRVLDPEGVEVFWAADLRARLGLEREPPRLVIHELRPGVSRWRMARMRDRPGLGFTAAFLPPRRGAPGAPATVPPPPPRERTRPVEAPPRRSGPPRFQVAIASAQLDGLTATFDFPGWGLELANIRAEGSFWAAAPVGDRPPLGFEVRNIDARSGGSLRILGQRNGARVPFDRARLDWIGTPRHTPADLLLLVSAATTGRSVLSGRAQFVSLFGGRRAWQGASGVPRPGMQIDASWERAGEALTAVAAGRGLRTLQVAGDDARLEVKVRGPFRDLRTRFEASGLDVGVAGFRLRDLGLELAVRGPPVRVELDRLAFASPGGGTVQVHGALTGAGTARIRLQVDQLQTGALLPPYLRPLIGGTARGWLAARADLRREAFVLEGMDLALERDRRGPLPRSLRLATGRPPQPPPPAAADALFGSLQGLRYERGTLTVAEAAASAFGAQLVLSGRLQGGGLARGERRAPHLEASLIARGVDLARALPGTPLTGSLSLAAQARGPLDDLTARVRFRPPAAIGVFDQRYGLPAQIEARVRGDLLELSPFELSPPGGGRLAVGGKVVFDREVALDLDVDGHRLDRLPVVARRLAGVAGELSGKLRLRGAGDRATLAGEIDLAAREVPLSALGPRLPPLERAAFKIAGGFDLVLERRKPFQLAAEIRDLEVAYGCPQAPAARVAAARCLRVQNLAPVRLRSVGGLRQVELARTRLRAGTSELALDGRLADGDLDARVEGHLGVGLFEPLYRRWPVSLAGTIEAALRARGSVRSPRVEGTLKVGEPLVVRHRSGRLELQLTEGTLSLEGGRLRGSGLGLSGHGVRLRLDGDMPAGSTIGPQSPLRVALAGEIDTAVLARSFPEVVAAATGTVRLDGQLAGSLAQPRLDGQLEIGPLGVRLRQRDIELSVHPARLAARDNRLTAAGLVVDARPGGRVVIGPPGAPAQIELRSLVPFVLGDLRLPATGRALHLDLPWLALDQGAFDVVLQGDASQGPLRLGGRVEIGAGRYHPGRQPRPSSNSAVARVARRLPRSMRPATLPVLLDLHIVSDGRRFVIDPGWLPDLHLGLDVRVGGTATRPKVVWEAAPRGLYSRFVYLLYRLFS